MNFMKVQVRSTKADTLISLVTSAPPKHTFRCNGLQVQGRRIQDEVKKQTVKQYIQCEPNEKVHKELTVFALKKTTKETTHLNM